MRLTPRQQERVGEIKARLPTIAIDSDTVDPTVALVAVDGASADALGVFPMLWVAENGSVAEATVNHPQYFASLAELVEAHA